MNDHDFGGWDYDDREFGEYSIPGSMTWSPLWQDRTPDAAPMRSHP